MSGQRHLLLCLFVFAGCTSDSGQVLTLTTTTSTENSGLLGHLHPDFEQRTGILVRVVANGTGAALQLAREGNADVVLVHAPALEERFVTEGHGLARVPVMYNDFVLLGPEDGPLGLGCEDTSAALAKVAEAQAIFVSRGDASGTHVKEQELWQASGVALEDRSTLAGASDQHILQPIGDWYHAVGQGMGPTIGYATERRGYALSDRGTFYALALDDPPRTDLAIVCQGDPRLANPYSVIAVNPATHPHVQAEAAQAYVDWLVSPDTQALIGAYRKGGEQLFHPGPAPAAPEAESLSDGTGS
jgi:tungstate transport system substrate-binding protein